MTRLSMLCGLVIAALTLSGPVFAGAHKATTDSGSAESHGKQHGGHHGKGSDGMGMMHPRMADKLGLDDTQKQELAALLEIYRPRFKELRERGEAPRKELLAMAPDDEGYSALTEKVSEDAGRAAAEVVVLMAELQSNTYALLTPEQQTEFMAMRANMSERMQKRREGMGERGKHHKGHHGKHRQGHDAHKGKHGDGHVCVHGEDGICPHHPDAKDSDSE